MAASLRSLATTARQQVQPLGLIEFAALPADHGLHIHRMTGGRVVVPQVGHGQRGIEAVAGGRDVPVNMVGAGDPAQHARHLRGVGCGPNLPHGPFVGRTRGLAMSGSLFLPSACHQRVEVHVRRGRALICHGCGDGEAPGFRRGGSKHGTTQTKEG
jgi:hypothetical protein